jgi:hypothetical protein
MGRALPEALGIRAMSMREYLDTRAVSSGMCQTIYAQSPLHAWYQSAWNPYREDRAGKFADIGSYAHACLLEGGMTNVCVLDPADFPNASGGGVATGWTNKAIRSARDEARAAGQLPILRSDFDAVLAMVNAAKEYIGQSELAGVLEGGEAEVSILFEHRGVQCKARADWVKGHTCLSYKTTASSANPRAWARMQLPGYDIASAFYERAVAAGYGLRGVNVVHLVQEQSPPYACSLVALAPAWRDLANAKLDAALTAWRAWLDAPKAAPYEGHIAYAEPRAWDITEYEEREMAKVLERADLSEDGRW